MTASQRKPISVRQEHYDFACQLRDELAAVSDRTITLTDVISRALQCLADAHQRGAWLSPQEAAPLLERRHMDGIASALAQLAAHLGTPVETIRFFPAQHRIEVKLADTEPMPIYAGPLHGSSPTETVPPN